MTNDRPPRPAPDEPFLIKENPASYLVQDAQRALSAARDARERGNADVEASHARAALLLYFAALEAFINFVYAYSDVKDDACERWSTERKWRRAAEQCLPGHGTIHNENDEVLYRPGDPIEPFDADHDLLARFIELRDARNDMVHSQPDFTLVEQHRIDVHFATVEHYPRTGLPTKLSHFRVQHAETVATLFNDMVTRLDVCLKGVVADLLQSPALYEYNAGDGYDWDD